MLRIATSNEISERPTAQEFSRVLHNWIGEASDFDRYNRNQWKESIDLLFPVTVPKRVEFEEVDEIIRVLNHIAVVKNMAHTMFPESGGLDLREVAKAAEPGFIELKFGYTFIMKPLRLMFESFNSNYEWFYFRLEADHIKPTGVDKGASEESYCEYLTEVKPGEYEDYEFYENELANHEYSPTEWNPRQVYRILKGDYVLFSKRSVYNSNPMTYDGRHDKMDADTFRDYIKRDAE